VRQRFQIAPENKRQFANLYSIIQSLEALKQCYAEGGVEPEKFEVQLRDLVRQYGMVQNALALSIDDVRRFCIACGVQGQYAMEILRNPDAALQKLLARKQSQQGAALVFDLAQICVEVVDHSYATTDPATWIQVIASLEGRLCESGAIPKFSEAVNFVGKWRLYFNSLHQSEEVPQEKREEVRIEVSDLSKMLKGWLAQGTR
jgi:hypothetical protein